MKLNLGCGHDYVDDWVNVDFYDNSKCDVEFFSTPFDEESVNKSLGREYDHGRVTRP